MRLDLLKDYELVVDDPSAVRGTVIATTTAQAYYSGRVTFVCEFDEFDVDTPLNRVLKAAAAMVLRSPRLQSETRKRARSLVLRMNDVGALRPADTNAHLDRRAMYCADAFGLARHLLRSIGRALSGADVPVWTFLIRTPELVEAGVRQLIQRRLPNHTVVKCGLRLVPSTMTLTPDLFFGDSVAVADVKYKLATDEWKRGDLYQAVTFATGYHARHAAILEFAPADCACLGTLPVGDVTVRHLCWPADGQMSPEDAAACFVSSVGAWLDETARSGRPAAAAR
jgi:5-methylcytosine-specific restriction enzyme subunit McrC